MAAKQSYHTRASTWRFDLSCDQARVGCAPSLSDTGPVMQAIPAHTVYGALPIGLPDRPGRRGEVNGHWGSGGAAEQGVGDVGRGGVGSALSVYLFLGHGGERTVREWSARSRGALGPMPGDWLGRGRRGETC